MWYHVFLWALFSSFLVHAVASAIAFCRLRSHKIGRFIPVAILAMGIIWPITGGAVTSMCNCIPSFFVWFLFYVYFGLFLNFRNIHSWPKRVQFSVHHVHATRLHIFFRVN